MLFSGILSLSAALSYQAPCEFESGTRPKSDERGPPQKTALNDLGKRVKTNRRLVTKGIKRNQKRYITKGHVPFNANKLNNFPVCEQRVTVENVERHSRIARHSS
jgi:hypothetical protein